MRAKIEQFLRSLDRTSTSGWFIGVMWVAMLERIGLWMIYEPAVYGDTNSYWRLAEGVRGGFKVYDGTRTPGYPMLLALFETPEQAWQVQTVMGLMIVGLLFFVGWKITKRGWFGGLMALAQCLNMAQLFFEPSILSETAATFWIVMTFAGLVVWVNYPRWRKGVPGVLLGIGMAICVSMAWLTRTVFVYLPVWILLLLVGMQLQEGEFPFKFLRFSKSARLPILAYILPVIAVLAMWVGWMKYTYGEWSLTTMTGYHMIQHTGLFFEYVPDEYAGLRDVYLEYRDLQIAEHGSPANAIWDAIPEMQEVSGLSFYDLSRTLQRISTRLIIEHPFLYLRNVVQGWWYFWRAPVYWQPELVRWAGFVPIVSAWVLISRLAVFTMNMLFLVGSIGAVISKRLRKRLNLPPIAWHLAGSIWIVSILQTLADHGDNPRFLVPLQPLVVLWVLFAGYRLLISLVSTSEWRRLTAAAVRSMEP